MIDVIQVTKRFQNQIALEEMSTTIQSGSVFGLIGTNGAGKSTLLRLCAGILKPDSGQILIDGSPVYENPEVKKRFFYISDESYFFHHITVEELKNYYKMIYEAFDEARFYRLMDGFGLPVKGMIHTFSKGMKKQVSIICGISSGTEYLFCDETFDGLDPVMRQAVKSLFAKDMMERAFTPIIASHNLRELEDICDHVGLLHKGGLLLSNNLEDMKLNIHRIQCVLQEGMEIASIQGLDIIKIEKRGKLVVLTLRGEREQISSILESYNPVFYEMIPLSLEEIFISETEVIGYDIKKIIF